ncbi:Hypothetical protein AJF4211_000080 [Avibacterium paragallinarum JF4211]|nr:Hypothetical protein AJF4211_000080 [Avibacterium paragallinarum JF4211]
MIKSAVCFLVEFLPQGFACYLRQTAIEFAVSAGFVVGSAE